MLRCYLILWLGTWKFHHESKIAKIEDFTNTTKSALKAKKAFTIIAVETDLAYVVVNFKINLYAVKAFGVKPLEQDKSSNINRNS